MRALPSLALALALALALVAGCSKPDTYLLVTATNSGPPLTLKSLDIRATSGASMPKVSFSRGASFTVPPDATFALKVDGAVPSGEITLDITAVGVAGNTVASVTTRVTLKPNETTPLTVSLGAGMVDAGTGDLTPSPDMTLSGDLAGADLLVLPDLVVVPDLLLPDLARPDLAAPDLVVPVVVDAASAADQVMPADAILPDLRVVPDLVVVPDLKVPPDMLAVPTAPTNLSATPGNAQVSLLWNASTGATSYSVRRGTTSGSYTTIATGVTTTSFLDNIGLTNGQNYFYVVFAVNGAGSSGNSNEASATPNVTLFQRVDSTTFRTYASSNSSNGAVPASSCTIADASCHAVDGDQSDTAHAWSSGVAAAPYLQVDSGNANWGKHIDHFTIVYSTTACTAGNLQFDWHPPGSVGWNATPGYPCVANVKTTINATINADSWGFSLRNNSASTSLTVFEVQFWTTN